jgi:hypothetical protein
VHTNYSELYLQYRNPKPYPNLLTRNIYFDIFYISPRARIQPCQNHYDFRVSSSILCTFACHLRNRPFFDATNSTRQPRIKPHPNHPPRLQVNRQPLGLARRHSASTLIPLLSLSFHLQLARVYYCRPVVPKTISPMVNRHLVTSAKWY